MNRLSIALFMFLAATFALGQIEQSSFKGSYIYPNELPQLKLYQEAKWSALEPYVSTRADVDRILGEPVPVYDELLRDYVNGYEYDGEWKVVITYIGQGGDLPDSLVGRVSHITLYPQKRVSLRGVEFLPTFSRYTYKDRRDSNVEGIVYYDKFGLRYSVYSKDSPDGRVHAGDLYLIIYGPSDEQTAKYTNKVKTHP
jgi:hypothetical protein